MRQINTAQGPALLSQHTCCLLITIKRRLRRHVLSLPYFCGRWGGSSVNADILAEAVTHFKEMENCENDFIHESALENDETDSFYEAESASVGASSSATDESSLGSFSQLGKRRGSACRQLQPFPTIQQVQQMIGDHTKNKSYVKKVQ